MEQENQPQKRTVPKSIDEIVEIMKKHSESGLSMKAFCERDEINVGTFHNWRKRIKNLRGHFVKVQSPASISERYQLIMKNGILEFSGMRLSTVVNELRECGLC